MKPMKIVSIGKFASHILAVAMVTTAVAVETAPAPLPFVRDFDSGKFLGKWYVWATLTTPSEPAPAFVALEYSAGKQAGQFAVRKTTFGKGGEKIAEIDGQAKLADGEPPGRFLVSYGAELPDAPNRHVVYVDEDYQYAVVGMPDRKSMWMLAREVPIDESTLRFLSRIAWEAGFNTGDQKLSHWVTLPWVKKPKAGKQPAAPEPPSEAEVATLFKVPGPAVSREVETQKNAPELEGLPIVWFATYRIGEPVLYRVELVCYQHGRQRKIWEMGAKRNAENPDLDYKRINLADGSIIDHCFMKKYLFSTTSLMTKAGSFDYRLDIQPDFLAKKEDIPLDHFASAPDFIQKLTGQGKRGQGADGNGGQAR